MIVEQNKRYQLI